MVQKRVGPSYFDAVKLFWTHHNIRHFNAESICINSLVGWQLFTGRVFNMVLFEMKLKYLTKRRHDKVCNNAFSFLNIWIVSLQLGSKKIKCSCVGKQLMTIFM